MGGSCNESYEKFLDLLKQAGIEITNEAELRARLAESRRWHYAFRTLAANGRQIGISFEEGAASVDGAVIDRALAEFAFTEGEQSVLASVLKGGH